MLSFTRSRANQSSFNPGTRHDDGRAREKGEGVRKPMEGTRTTTRSVYAETHKTRLIYIANFIHKCNEKCFTTEI